MSPPLINSLTNSASAQNPPQESPEIQAARERSRQAGYARNRAEAAHKNAVEEKGVNSAEATAAKAELVKAQEEVERLQGELRQLLNLKTAAAKPQAKPAEKKPAKAGEKASPGEKPAEQPVQGEMLKTEIYELRYKKLDTKKIHEQLERLLKEIGPKEQSILLKRFEVPRSATILEVLKNPENINPTHLHKKVPKDE